MAKSTNRKPAFTKDELVYVFMAVDELLISGLNMKNLWDENDNRYEAIIEKLEVFFKDKEKSKEVLLKIHNKLVEFIGK